MSAGALLVVDLVQEWADKKSEYYLADLQEIVARTNKLIAAAKKTGRKIVLVRHVEPEPADCFQDGKGAEFLPKLNIAAADLAVTKHKISPFYQTALDKYLTENKIQSLWLAGVLTNLCVRSAAADAYDRGLEITIFEDCCTTFDKKVHQFTLEDLKATRPEIEIATLAGLASLDK